MNAESVQSGSLASLSDFWLSLSRIFTRDVWNLPMTREPGSPPPPGEIDEARRKMLQGKNLVSRPMWLMRRLTYVAVLIVALIGVLTFADGVWLAIGLTILAFAAGMLPELF